MFAQMLGDLASTPHVQFTEQVVDMRLCRGDADILSTSNFFVAEPVPD